MLRKTEKIKLLIGVFIVIGIFVFIGISTHIERLKNWADLTNFESKYSSNISSEYCNDVIDILSLNAQDLKAYKDENVIGFSLSTDSLSSFEIVKSKLFENGWSYVESGSGASASFYKDWGQHKWIFVNCVDIGRGSSVVITSY